jgi:hypothetical protein
MGEKNWKLMYIDEIWTYGPHFFLYHVPSRQNFDLTADQYTVQGLDVPYYLGRPEKQIGKYMPYGQQFANSVAEYLNNVKASTISIELPTITRIASLQVVDNRDNYIYLSSYLDDEFVIDKDGNIYLLDY